MRWLPALLLAVTACSAPAVQSTPGSPTPTPLRLGAPTALSRIHIAAPVNDGTYVRSAFGNGWADADHNGCSTREDIMARDLTNKTLVKCNVVAGDLHDPYTGRDIHYSESKSYTVQIDHIVPLAYAWREGAEHWTPEQRKTFANDPRELLAVDGRANAQKSDSGPGEWLPVNRAYVCTYARKFIAVAYAYRLRISQQDHDSLQRALGTC